LSDGKCADYGQACEDYGQAWENYRLADLMPPTKAAWAMHIAIVVCTLPMIIPKPFTICPAFAALFLGTGRAQT
jgi:hypothetical protein